MPNDPIESQVAREARRRGNASRLVGYDRKGRSTRRSRAARTSARGRRAADPQGTLRKRSAAALRSIARRRRRHGDFASPGTRALARREKLTNLYNILFYRP